MSGPILKLGFTVALFIGIAIGAGSGPVGLFAVLICVMILGIMWAGAIGEWLGSGFVGAFSGGGPAERQPVYSIAETHLVQGRRDAAIAEIEKQLTEFPGDFTGQMLLARIHMENRKDLPAARGVVEEVAAQPHHKPGQVASALTTLADWQLAEGETENAKTTLRAVVQRFPDTPVELACAQRLARLDGLIEWDDRRDTGQLVSDCLKQLEAHPLDNDTREKLARVYFERYEEPGKALVELEVLIQRPHQPLQNVARYIMRSSDWRLKIGDKEGARACLQRFIAAHPNSAHADRVRDRLTVINE